MEEISGVASKIFNIFVTVFDGKKATGEAKPEKSYWLKVVQPVSEMDNVRWWKNKVFADLQTVNILAMSQKELIDLRLWQFVTTQKLRAVYIKFVIFYLKKSANSWPLRSQ